MTHPLPLILNVSPVQRGPLAAAQGTVPNVAVVYATGAGQLAYFGGRPLSWGEKAFTKYRTRYDVDMSDFRRTAELRSTPLPSRGDYYFFIATVDVAFRVHNPEEVVRRFVRDALPVVYGFLANRFRVITRSFDIEQSTEAEDAIRRAFAAPIPLPEGITIFEVSPRLLPDENASRYLQKKAEAARALQTGKAEYELKLQQAMQAGELEELNRLHKQKLAQRELAAMQGPLTAMKMAQIHLANNPGDTAQVMQLLMQHEQAMIERQDAGNMRTTEFVKFMMMNNVMKAADIEPFLQASMVQMGLPGASTQGAIGSTPSDWTQDPVLQPSGPAQPAGSAPVQAKPDPIVLEQDPASKVWKPADGVQPIYVLFDESAAAAPYIQDLTSGVGLLLDALVRRPEVAPAIRLSVLGYAERLDTKLPLDEVSSTSQLPWLDARGEADYAGALEGLLAAITPDIEGLKAQRLTVRRPIVYLLCISKPADDGLWRPSYTRLTDPAQHKYAPQVIACGVGAATAQLITALATRREFGSLMAPNADVHGAIQQYWQTLARNVLATGLSLINGAPQLQVEPPAGFRPAAEMN